MPTAGGPDPDVHSEQVGDAGPPVVLPHAIADGPLEVRTEYRGAALLTRANRGVTERGTERTGGTADEGRSNVDRPIAGIRQRVVARRLDPSLVVGALVVPTGGVRSPVDRTVTVGLRAVVVGTLYHLPLEGLAG